MLCLSVYCVCLLYLDLESVSNFIVLLLNLVSFLSNLVTALHLSILYSTYVLMSTLPLKDSVGLVCCAGSSSLVYVSGLSRLKLIPVSLC